MWYEKINSDIISQVIKKSVIFLPKGTKVPDHIAVIPDGNRRWARTRGFKPTQGHIEGAKRVTEVSKAARSWGVHTITFWGLSTENWLKRSDSEVKLLMKIISHFLDENLKEAQKEDVRIVHLGRKDRLPKALVGKILQAEHMTRNNKKYIFNVALDYGGQDEIIRAVKKMMKDDVDPNDVDIGLLDSYMDTATQPYPYPDLIIRTSGEQRTSGLLLWQSHYAEIYWERDHLPDFTTEKLKEAILDYSRRRRRFGGNDVEEHFKFKPELSAELELAWWRLSNIPEGTRFRDYAVKHLKEQYGLSKQLTLEAAKYIVLAIIHGRKNKWDRSMIATKKFYKLIKDELKLAFEPSIVASLQVKFWREMNKTEDVEKASDVENTARKLYAEVYRISLFQAAKIAHLRVLANIERNLAEKGRGDWHWKKAEDYLEKFYYALKERVA